MTMKKILAAVMLAGGIAVMGVLASSPAQATGDKKHTPTCGIPTGWFVNGDEQALKPKQTWEGLLFEGPSIIHHAVSPVISLKDGYDGGFMTSGHVQGVKPLFKLETTAPYSTVNKVGDKWWSSKIPSGDGSQSHPVSLSVLATKAPYTASTKITTFGVGYANDTGNKAIVTLIWYGKSKHDMKCHTSPNASASATASPTKSMSTSPTPSKSTSTAPAGTTPTLDSGTPSLPVTGAKTVVAVGVGLAAITAGVVAFVVGRRRRIRFEA